MSNITFILSTIFSVFALILGVLNLYLFYKNRLNNHSVHIYARQLDILDAYHRKLLELENILIDVEIELDEDDRSEQEIDRVTKKAEKLFWKLNDVLNAGAIFLSQNLEKDLHTFTAQINIIFKKIKERNITEDDFLNLTDEIADLEDRIREEIGLDKLSNETKMLLKSHRNRN